jgi:prepilin-type N-terminal cleavage/methylation domain-containing protein
LALTACRRLYIHFSDAMSKQFIKSRGFSLLELLAVVTILGVIAALIVPRVIGGSDAAKEKSCQHNRTEINIAVERFYIHNGAWPANNLSDIAADPDYFPDGLPACPVSGNTYQLDGTLHRVQSHTGPGVH